MSKRDTVLLVILLIVMSMTLLIMVLHVFFGLWRPAFELSPMPEPHLAENSQRTVSPHKEKVDYLQQQAGTHLSRIARLIIAEEGIGTKAYQDKRGYVAIGIGRSLQTNGISTQELFAIVSEPDVRFIMEHTKITKGRILIDSLDIANRIFSNPLTEHDLELLLMDDLKNTKSEAVRVFGDAWYQIDPVRQEAVIDILFNLGLPHFKGFVNFIDAVKQQDWKTAASELLLSEAARQNYTRYNHVALVIDTGDEHYFNLSK